MSREGVLLLRGAAFGFDRADKGEKSVLHFVVEHVEGLEVSVGDEAATAAASR
ncbi:MAG: hypothetical protein L0Z50_18800 [Verrucomicrobiales bacterium]|nr:hypothetical protein [Verrucomicrobiales bacterium]